MLSSHTKSTRTRTVLRRYTSQPKVELAKNLPTLIFPLLFRLVDTRRVSNSQHTCYHVVKSGSNHGWTKDHQPTAVLVVWKTSLASLKSHSYTHAALQVFLVIFLLLSDDTERQQEKARVESDMPALRQERVLLRGRRCVERAQRAQPCWSLKGRRSALLRAHVAVDCGDGTRGLQPIKTG